MSTLKLKGSTSGYVELTAPATAGDNTITLPTTAGTVVVADGSGNLNISGIITATTFSGNVSGNITIGAGSVSAPSLAPSGDSNTGIFFPAADTIAFAEGGAEVARFSSSGRLGIGTVNPAGPLDVQANSSAEAIYIRAHSSPEIGQVLFRNNANSSTFFRISAESGSTQLRTVGSSYLAFDTNSTERVRILSSGGFRATTTGSYENTSAAHHEFVTTGNNNIMNIYHTDSNGGNCGGLYIKFTNAAPNGTGLAYRFDDNAAMRFLVRTNGGIANYQANDSNLCDEREKKNIVDLDSTWDCLKHWELKKFHYNEDDNDSDLRYGVIAQQISLHCPEVITEWVKQDASEAVLDEDGNEIEPAKEEIVRLAVKEQQMYWMAIKALQEAQERIETLEAENATLKNDFTALAARVTALESV